MRSLSPIVWREGMHLAQHHFQLRDRYFQDSAEYAISSLHFEPYGLTGLELDQDALLNGTVAVNHARGVMPDGLAFSFPEDPAPPPLEVEDRFSPTRESHLLLLTIPEYRPDRANVGDGSSPARSARFRGEPREVPDETTGQDEKEVTVARKNFRLVLDDEDLEGEVTLPLARIRRDRSGNFVYDRDYIPPCLQIGASEGILRKLAGLVEAMEEKARSLADEVERPGPGGELPSEEIARYWLLHALHSSLPSLRHHLETRTAHPEELFRELLRLGGALCTFAMESHPRQLPGYDHRDLETSFGSVDRHIRDHLEVVLPRGAIRVSLEPEKEYFRRGEVSDRRALGEAHWFLGVKAPGSRQDLVSDIPRLVKVCSWKHIERLVQAAHPGLNLEHVASPPSAITPRLGMEYFRVETDGPCWTSIQDTADVGVYAPEVLSDAELQILVIPEE